jgi:hypothetical protein
VPHPNARTLEREDAALRALYVAALQRESEAARDAEEVAKRVEAARREKDAHEREARIAKGVADAT